MTTAVVNHFEEIRVRIALANAELALFTEHARIACAELAAARDQAQALLDQQARDGACRGQYDDILINRQLAAALDSFIGRTYGNRRGLTRA